MIDEKKEKLLELFTDMTLKYSASEETSIYEYSACIKEECENLEKEVEEAIEEFKNVLYSNDVVQTGYIKLEYKKQTNGDKIRAMSDEELTRIILCPYDTAGKPAHIMPCVKDGKIQEMVSQEYCEKCILKWLKSEVDDQKPSEQDQPDQPAWKENMLRKFIGRRQ